LQASYLRIGTKLPSVQAGVGPFLCSFAAPALPTRSGHLTSGRRCSPISLTDRAPSPPLLPGAAGLALRLQPWEANPGDEAGQIPTTRRPSAARGASEQPELRSSAGRPLLLELPTHASSAPPLRTLLVGVNYRGTAHELKGTVNDVKEMHHNLCDKLGFPGDCVLELNSAPSCSFADSI
jgi:hypothetical protein